MTCPFWVDETTTHPLTLAYLILYYRLLETAIDWLKGHFVYLVCFRQREHTMISAQINYVWRSIGIFLLISIAHRETVYFRLVVFIDWTMFNTFFPKYHTISLTLGKMCVEYEYQWSYNVNYCPMSFFNKLFCFACEYLQTNIPAVRFPLNLHYSF